jgi:hypothetical protein
MSGTRRKRYFGGRDRTRKFDPKLPFTPFTVGEKIGRT